MALRSLIQCHHLQGNFTDASGFNSKPLLALVKHLLSEFMEFNCRIGPTVNIPVCPHQLGSLFVGCQALRRPGNKSSLCGFSSTSLHTTPRFSAGAFFFAVLCSLVYSMLHQSESNSLTGLDKFTKKRRTTAPPPLMIKHTAPLKSILQIS